MLFDIFLLHLFKYFSSLQKVNNDVHCQNILINDNPGSHVFILFNN
jgi:hypothetical protein